MSGPVLITPRLELWRPQPGDLAGLHDCMASPEARRFIGGPPASLADSFGRLLRGAGSWSLYGYGMFHLRLTGEPRIVGVAGLFHSWRGMGADFDDAAEAGWAVHPDCWGQGLAGEAMAAAQHWFDQNHGPRRTVCMIVAGHTASERIAARLGYRAFGRQTEDDGAELVLYGREAG